MPVTYGACPAESVAEITKKGSCVLMNLKDPDQQSPITISGIAMEVWLLLRASETSSVDSIMSELHKAGEGPYDDLAATVEAILSSLEEVSLVRKNV